MANILSFPDSGQLGVNDHFYSEKNGIDTKSTFKDIPVATDNNNGLMSSVDKRKLSIIHGDSFSLNYYTTSSNPVKGVKINTNMTLDRYAALRLEIDYGFCQNQISNEQISINIRYWEYNFLESQINKIGSKNHIGSIVAFLEGYKLGFFINFVNTPNVSGGLIGLRVMGAGNAIAITNQVESLEWSNANYIPGTNFKELIMNIPANSSLLASNYTANQQLFNTQQLTPPPRKFRANQQRIRQLFPGICEEYRDTG